LLKDVNVSEDEENFFQWKCDSEYENNSSSEEENDGDKNVSDLLS
jgi:hypothetical protein